MSSPDTTTIALGLTFLLLLFIAACIPRRKRFDSYSEYLASPTWKKLAAAARVRDGYRCRCCNRSDRLNVHHRCYPKVLGTERVEDLTTLCENCHELIHTRAGWQRKSGPS